MSRSSAPWWQRTARGRGRWHANLCLLRSRFFLPIVASYVVPNLENLLRVAACLRRRTLAWPLPRRNPLYIRYFGDSPGSYSPECVEEEFSELRPLPKERSSSPD